MPDWLTADDLRHHLELSTDPPAGDQVKLEDAVNAAVELVEKRTGEWTAGADLPALIRSAGILQAARFYKRQAAPFGIANVGTVDGGQGMRLFSRLDPDVEVMLAEHADYAGL